MVAFDPDLVGFTAMTNNYRSVEELLPLLKQRLSCPIVLGGPHATLFPKRLVANPHIDYVVYGEGEETMRELVSAFQEHGPRPPLERLGQILGLCFEDHGQAICNPPRPLIEDLDALPFPARHLLDLSRYPLYTSSGEPMVTVLSSRGCPYRCSYCYKGILGRSYRQRSPDDVMAEIHHLMEAFDYRAFYFIDDLFTFDNARLEALTDCIIEEGLDIRWQCLARVDTVDRHLLNKMYEAGCREIHYGVESGNPQILRELGKGITLDEVREATTWTTQVGILAKGYFMLGLPGDTEETMEETIAFASELEIDQAMFSLTTPFPGTRLWDELVARQPEVAFDQDFSQAYYYTTNRDQLIEPFLNVSQVSDARLAQLVQEAPVRFEEVKRRKKYVRALGGFLGNLLYGLSNVAWLRRLGHRLLRLPLLERIPGLSALGAYDWREEYQKKWS
jgi:radical SAM superfamily enzyme YgiQ (UPF0313 family)